MFKKSKPSNSKHAQSLIQYIVISTLVMAGIIIAGPYVIRSWNAHIQGVDDSVQDSFNDPLLEALPDDVDIPGCDCTWQQAVCGGASTIPGVDVDCTPQEMLEEVNCIPSGCENTYPINPKAQCVVDSCCCEVIAGAFPADCGLPINPAVPFTHCSDSYWKSPCPVGTLQSTLRCGGIPDQIICIDMPTCVGACETALPTTEGSWCPTDDINVPMYAANPPTFVYPLTTVNENDCGIPPEAVKCQFECDIDAGYFADGVICLQCPPFFVYMSDTCGTGECFHQPGCPAWSCWKK